MFVAPDYVNKGIEFTGRGCFFRFKTLIAWPSAENRSAITIGFRKIMIGSAQIGLLCCCELHQSVRVRI